MRSEPLPHDSASTEQYRSHPQQLRSGCFGCSGNFFAMPGASQNALEGVAAAMSDGALAGGVDGWERRDARTTSCVVS
ncbi:hypothetical protein X946_5106 [Burkholderia sp. ABCPW 111]|nr:hypothetical protein X946_5106 [Burkholderia sp. ABCPW 111]